MSRATQYLGRQWAQTWAPDPEASKRAARAALQSAREARLAGDPNRAELERRTAAVHRGNAQDVQGIYPSPRVLQRPTRFMHHDMKPTRRLP